MTFVSSRVATATLALAVLLALSGCNSQAESAAAMPPPPEVGVAKVLVKPVGEWDEFTGRISAVDSVELRPRVSGYVERIAFEEGQEVRKGDLLFVLDPRRAQSALDRATAELARARSEAQLAQAQNRRAQMLVDAKAISREEFEARRAASAQGDASVRAAQAAVESARLELTYTQVRAPISGRIGRALVTRGNLAQADATVLATLVSVDPVYVDFEADEQAVLRYQQSARDGHGGAQQAVRIGLANESGTPHEGRLDFIDNRLDPRTGTLHARAVLDNHERLYTPGLFARVQLQGGAAHDALLVDERAVLTDQDRKYVYVLGAKNTAERRDVVIGRSADGLRVVSQGLMPNDRVIVDGVQKVFMPGMPVAPKPMAMKAAAAAVAAR